MEPTPKQALALWRMLTADQPEIAEPKLSDVKPQLKPAERAALIDAGYLTTRKERRATRLMVTDKVWDWVAAATSSRLHESRADVGVEVLQALLNRLLPNLHAQGIALADVLRAPSSTSTRAKATKPATKPAAGAPQARTSAVLEAVRKLAGRSPTGAVRLASLRAELSAVSRVELDAALRTLRDGGTLVLFQDDDRASLTQADHQAALVEANTPHHLVYLENR